jgi:hypothetical protein
MTLEIEREFALGKDELDVWTSQKHITIEEGTMLLVRASPRHLHHPRWSTSRLYDVQKQLLDFIERELVGDEHFSRKVEPYRFLQMAESCRAYLPLEFRDAVLRNRRIKGPVFTVPIADQTISPQQAQMPVGEEQLDPRTKETLYKILFAIAVEKYHYKPEGTRSEVPAKIESALERQGLIVSQKTIRHHLKVASETAIKRK